VHRDIKPGNLMVRPDGVVKLTDFGIAQARDAAPLTRTGMVVGTAQYLSPEQAQGMEVTAASDVYSLGVVAYECLSGARPFDGASQVAIALAHINRPPPPLPAHIPPAVRLLVERALAKDPADRFPDGGAFAEAIRRVAAGGTLAAMPGPATSPTQVVGGLADARTQVLAATGATAVAGAVSPPTGPRGPMPPLQAPPEDDWGPDDEPADGRPRRGRWTWLAAALVLLLLLGAGIGYLLFSGNGGRGDATGGTTTAASSVASPTGIQLDPAAFIGDPVADVTARLEAAGLVVLEPEPADDDLLKELDKELDPGDVAGLEPSGGFALPGTEVTLFVAIDGYTPEDDTAPETTEQTKTTTVTETTQQTVPTTDQPGDTSTADTTTPTMGGTTATDTTTTTTESPAGAGQNPAVVTGTSE
jgi:serine/threonine-protein kinase